MVSSMSIFAKISVLALLATGFLTVPAINLQASGMSAHDNEYGDLRGLVDKTQSDLRAASDLGHGNKQRDRYQKAQDHLSKLDRSLSRNKYNKGALNDSIDEVKSILDHNTLQASARDALARDLTELKIARDRH
jgi:hypothetical protein